MFFTWNAVLIVSSVKILNAAVIQTPLQETALSSDSKSVWPQSFTIPPLGKPCYVDENSKECQFIRKNLKNDLWATNRPAAYFHQNWETCQKRFESCALPLDPQVKISPSNRTCLQGNVPTSFFNPQTTEELQRHVQMLYSKSIPFIVKNTGHDWLGRSAAKNLHAIWTHNLRHPDVKIEFGTFKLNCSSRPLEEVFHVGAGETWGGLYEFADKKQRAVLGGTCRTVGIAGWLQGGGHSPLTPVHGMGVDNVRQVEIITPSGDLKIANDCENEELFRAVRGGGGGTYGVITRITYKALERTSVKEFVADISNMTPTCTAELIEIMTKKAPVWADRAWGGYIKLNNQIELINPDGNMTDEQFRQDMGEVMAFLDARNIAYQNRTLDSWFQYFREHLEDAKYHVAGWSAGVATRLITPEVFSKEESRQELVQILATYAQEKLSPWVMLVTPTKFPHTKDSALNPTWSRATWLVRINSQYDQFQDPNYIPHFSRVYEQMDKLRKLVPESGVSINEADIWEPNYENAFWGENYNKLLDVKRTVDPKNLMSTYMAVNWNRSDSRYECYP